MKKDYFTPSIVVCSFEMRNIMGNVNSNSEGTGDLAKPTGNGGANIDWENSDEEK